MHMASFVTGQEVTKLSADTVSCLEQRVLEDDAMVNFRMDGGAVGRLWTSSIAIGRQHGLGIQVFGETGGLRWSQEQPNQLFYMPLNKRLQIIERGEANLSPEADRTWDRRSWTRALSTAWSLPRRALICTNFSCEPTSSGGLVGAAKAEESPEGR